MRSDAMKAERRNNGQRTGAARPLMFSHFNPNYYRLQHQGILRNRSAAGACFHTSQKCRPGTLVFIRNHDRLKADVAGADVAGATAADATAAGMGGRRNDAHIAEIRWCKASGDPAAIDRKWEIGVRYL